MPRLSDNALDEKAAERPRVLVVDDDEGLLEMYGQLLVDAGYAVAFARTGKDALDLLDWNPDLILLDLLMPVMDGYEFLRRLRESSSGKDIPVVVVSGAGNPDMPQGSDVVLRKPFDVQRLLRAVEIFMSARAPS